MGSRSINSSALRIKRGPNKYKGLKPSNSSSKRDKVRWEWDSKWIKTLRANSLSAVVLITTCPWAQTLCSTMTTGERKTALIATPMARLLDLQEATTRSEVARWSLGLPPAQISWKTRTITTSNTTCLCYDQSNKTCPICQMSITIKFLRWHLRARSFLVAREVEVSEHLTEETRKSSSWAIPTRCKWWLKSIQEAEIITVQIPSMVGKDHREQRRKEATFSAVKSEEDTPTLKWGRWDQSWTRYRSISRSLPTLISTIIASPTDIWWPILLMATTARLNTTVNQNTFLIKRR